VEIVVTFSPIQGFHSLLEMLRSQVSVSDGHIDVLMAHKDLDCSEVHSGHYQPGCKCVPEIMEIKVLDPCPIYSFVKNRADQPIGSSLGVQEELRRAVRSSF